MADYYPLLARALDALPDRSPALRKAVYDRARGALTAQLRSLDPPVAEADIELERKSLDGAIERLEAQYGNPAAAVEPAPPPPPPVTPPPPPKPEPKPEPPSVPKEPESPPPLPETPEPIPEPEAPAPKPVEPEPEPAPAERPPAEFVPFVPPTRKSEAGATPPTEEPVGDEPPVELTAPAPKPGEALSAPTRRPKIDVVAPKAGRSRMLRNGIVGGVLLAVIGGIGFAAYVLRDQPTALPQGSDTEESAQTEQQEQKFADRVGGESAEPQRRSPSAPPPDVTVAQRAILYEENTADPKGTPKTTQGRVVWRLEPVSGEQGQPLQSAIRALVEYPDLGFSLTLTIRKNVDATLPASHTIELAFSSKSEGDDRSVQEVGLPQLKEDQNVRGAQISGLPVRVRDNLFLVGLSNLPSDIERNTALLTQKQWIDIAVKFKSGPRAVLAIDKGAAGTQVMQSAFDQWRE